MGIKAVLRNTIADLLFFTGISAPGRRGRGQLSVVTFHRVLPEAERRKYPFPGLVVTPEELDVFLSYFTRHFDCGNLAAQHKRYVGGEKTERPLLGITFDDAQHDNHKHARAVLAKHQVKASFFVPVSAVDRRELLWHDRLGFAIQNLLNQGDSGRGDLMKIVAEAGLSGIAGQNIVYRVAEASKSITLRDRLRLVESLEKAAGQGQVPDFARLMTFDEIADLAADGHEIGSHSMTHCLMPECDDHALNYEVEESRRILQARIQQPIETFCYPNGNSDTRTALAVARAGYSRAVTTAWGCNGEHADRFQLLRFDMVASHVMSGNGKFLPALLAFRMSGFHPGLD